MLDTILRCSLFCQCYSNPTKTKLLHLYSILQSTGDTLFNTLCMGNCYYALKTQRNVKNSLSAPHNQQHIQDYIKIGKFRTSLVVQWLRLSITWPLMQ